MKRSHLMFIELDILRPWILKTQLGILLQRRAAENSAEGKTRAALMSLLCSRCLQVYLKRHIFTCCLTAHMLFLADEFTSFLLIVDVSLFSYVKCCVY